jgi:excisionase family DNA binding protein
MFESQKRTTRFCAHRCAARNYKLRKRLESKKQVEADTIQRVKPKVNALNLELIKKKEYLTVPEVALLFSCSKKTIYRMIEAKEIKANNILERMTRIERKSIDKLFESK